MAATHADGFPLYNEDGSLKERTENFWTVSKDGNWEYENDPSGTLTGNQKPTSEYLAEQKKAGYDWDTEANNWIPITEEARDATIYQATEAARVRRPETLAEAEVSLEAAKKGIVDDTLKIKDPLEVGGFKKNPDGTIQMYPAGHDKAGQPIPVVEDLTTDGNSKIKFCQALRQAGAKVDHTFVVFYYDIFPQTRDLLKKINLEMHSLATWWDVLKVAKENNYFDTKSIGEVENFLNDPMKWSGMNGGISSLAE